MSEAGPRRVLLLGLDGVTFDLLEPLWAEGSCPNTKRLASGVRGKLRSVSPPLSFPAWSTFLTGNDPGRHGIFGFTGPEPGSYRLRFLNAGDRRGKSIWMRLSEADRRVCCLGVPATYPPERVNGAMVCGFDAPGVDGCADRSAVYPPGLLGEMEEAEGPYVIAADIRPLMEQGRLEEALDLVLDTVDRKARHALHLYRREDWQVFMVVFGETDLVGHHFWRFHDPTSPFPVEDAPERLAGAVREVYERVDRWVGSFLEAARKRGGTAVVALSDHGFGGAGDRVLRANRFLERQDLLAFRGGGSGPLAGLLGAAKSWGLKTLPNAWKRALFRHAGRLVGSWEAHLRYGDIDWSRTLAWSDEAPNYPAFRVNLEGREPRGAVPPSEYEAVRDRLAAALEAWRDPVDGIPVVRRVLRREEAYEGPEVERAPDLLADWNLPDGYSYLSRASMTGAEPLERLPEETLRRPGFHDKSGSHRADGIFLAEGPGLADGVSIEEGSAHLRDLCPTVLHLAGLPVPAGIDGRVLTEALDFDFLRARPPRRVDDGGEPGETPSPYSPEEEAVIAERLKGMGYL